LRPNCLAETNATRLKRIDVAGSFARCSIIGEPPQKPEIKNR
jgi:hypothetical protein